jgi:hypothetical protein
MNIFDLIKILYLKKDIKYKDLSFIGMKECIPLVNFLAQDTSIVQDLKKSLDYLFNIDPICFFMYLYCVIPKRSKVPFLKLPKASEVKDDVLLDKIGYVMGWTKAELKKNKETLEKLVNIDRKFFEERYGVA